MLQLIRRRHRMVAAGLAGGAAAGVVPGAAHAAGAGGGGGGAMPWLTPLQNLSNALSGQTAGYIAIIGVFVCACMLIWGGEMSEFARRVVMLIMVIAILLGINVFIQSTFAAGAVLALQGSAAWLA